MQSIKVTFNYQHGTNDYTIEATVTPGIKSVRGEFDRFQEPYDEDTVEIVSVVDKDGYAFEYSFITSLFTSKEIREIEALAIEAAAEEAEPEYED